MARPSLAVPLRRIMEAIEATGSLRGASAHLGMSRTALTSRLLKEGIPIPDRDESMRRRKLVRAEAHADEVRFAVSETVEWIGEPGEDGATQVITRTFRAFEPCLWPGCAGERNGHGACETHIASLVELQPNGRCAWPDCTTEVVFDVLCTYHRGRVDGRLS